MSPSPISIWRKTLSYLYPQVLQRAKSITGKQVHVELSLGRLQLIYGSTIYSDGDRYSSFRLAFHQKPPSHETNSILLLGLGLGSIPDILKKSGLSASITAVEQDPEIIRLWSNWRATDQKNVSVIQQDAWDYIREMDTKFDLICVDVFVGQEVPEFLMTKKAMECLYKMLNPGGAVYFSHINPLSINFFHSIFSNIFAEAELMKVRYNWMLVGKRIQESEV